MDLEPLQARKIICLTRRMQVASALEVAVMTLHALQVNEYTFHAARLATSFDLIGCVAALTRVAVAPLLVHYAMPLMSEAPATLDQVHTMWQMFSGMMALSIPFVLLYMLVFVSLSVPWLASRMDESATSVPFYIPAVPLAVSFIIVAISFQLWTEVSRLDEARDEAYARLRSRQEEEPIGRPNIMSSERFRTVIFGQDSGPQEHGLQTTCTICFNEFRDGQVVALLPCNHAFHWACIDSWLMRSQSCPMRCEQNLSEAAASQV
eukprot:TRINITY_DN28831_c0_g1_i1.p1 TRINITY_DN28831_c0_g1~~TRINITY_DN28831_c0_g1_i1.p1  ORF type:complete len:264 (-),score=20.42 TRINITY_DN28831_c0_g1_i1:15-806(-)